MVSTLNRCLDDSALDDKVLSQVFETYWPQFERDFSLAINQNVPTEKSEPRAESDILAEILENTRALASRVRRLEDARPSHARPESAQINFENFPSSPEEIRKRENRDKIVKSWLKNAIIKEHAGQVIAVIDGQDTPSRLMQKLMIESLRNDGYPVERLIFNGVHSE